MAEAETVATKLGMELPVTIDQRIAGAEKVGEHKTSLLHGLAAGRPIEIEAIAAAVVEPGGRSMYASTRLLDQISRGVLS